MQAIILTFIIPAIALIFTAVFFALWWNDRRQKHVLAYGICYGSMSAGVGINIWIFQGLDPVGVVAYHFLSVGGMIALMWGAARRAEVRAPVAVSALIVALSSIILYYAVVLGLPDGMKMAQNTSSALIISMTALTLWFGKKHYWSDHALIWTLGLLATFGFIRPLMTVFAPRVLDEASSAASILTAIHVLALATLLTLMALFLTASIIQDTMQRQRDEARIDPLTGLRLRAAFEEDAARLLARATQAGVPVSMVVCDIDHFKRINDGWGHAVGDIVIANVGKLIGGTIRGTDVAGRIGGEEFCIFVWNGNREATRKLAERLREKASKVGEGVAGDSFRITCSFGVAERKPDETHASLFERADAALYRAKNGGRNKVIADGLEGQFEDRRAPSEPVSILG